MSDQVLTEILLFISIGFFIAAFFVIYSSLVFSILKRKEIRSPLIAPSLIGVILVDLSLIYLFANYPYSWALNKFYVIFLPLTFCVIYFLKEKLVKNTSNLNEKELKLIKKYEHFYYFLGGSVLFYFIMMSTIKL